MIMFFIFHRELFNLVNKSEMSSSNWKLIECIFFSLLALQIQMNEASYIELSTHKQYVMKERDNMPCKVGSFPKSQTAVIFL